MIWQQAPQLSQLSSSVRFKMIHSHSSDKHGPMYCEFQTLTELPASDIPRIRNASATRFWGTCAVAAMARSFVNREPGLYHSRPSCIVCENSDFGSWLRVERKGRGHDRRVVGASSATVEVIDFYAD